VSNLRMQTMAAAHGNGCRTDRPDLRQGHAVLSRLARSAERRVGARLLRSVVSLAGQSRFTVRGDGPHVYAMSAPLKNARFLAAMRVVGKQAMAYIRIAAAGARVGQASGGVPPGGQRCAQASIAYGVWRRVGYKTSSPLTLLA
jgi:hypothetical protein